MTLEIGKVGISVLSNFENKLCTVICHIFFTSMYHDQFQFELKLLQMVTGSIFFHWKPYKNANIANFVHYEKTRLIKCNGSIFLENIFIEINVE